MTEESTTGRLAGASAPAPVDGGWRLGKIDIRSTVGDHAWPVARVELIHPTRGKVTDIGTAPGAFDAALAATGHIVGISPRLLSYNVTSHAPAIEGALSATVEMELEFNGETYFGSSFGVDLMKCTLAAWLDAAGKISGADEVRSERVARPYQVSAIDENDDLWIFASSDREAARAIELEFGVDGHSQVRTLEPRHQTLE